MFVIHHHVTNVPSKLCVCARAQIVGIAHNEKIRAHRKFVIVIKIIVNIRAYSNCLKKRKLTEVW